MSIKHDHCKTHDSHICGCTSDPAQASFDKVKQSVTKLLSDYRKVRAALVGLVGVDTKAELEQMYWSAKVLPPPECHEREDVLAAICALRDTLED